MNLYRLFPYIGSIYTPNVLFFDLCFNTAYAAHYVYYFITFTSVVFSTALAILFNTFEKLESEKKQPQNDQYRVEAFTKFIVTKVQGGRTLIGQTESRDTLPTNDDKLIRHVAKRAV